MKELITYLVGILLGVLLTVAVLWDTHIRPQPQNDLIWIGDTRVHKDSIIDPKPIFNASGEQEGLWIKVTYQGSDVFIECVDELGYTWEEWSESWLMAFKEETE